MLSIQNSALFHVVYSICCCHNWGYESDLPKSIPKHFQSFQCKVDTTQECDRMILLAYIFVFILGGTLGFVIACVLVAGRS